MSNVFFPFGEVTMACVEKGVRSAALSPLSEPVWKNLCENSGFSISQ